MSLLEDDTFNECNQCILETSLIVTTPIKLLVMSLPARASKRLSVRLLAPFYTLWGPSTIGETCGKTAQSGNNVESFKKFPVRSFATESVTANEGGLSTSNKNQDQESTLFERTEKNILQRMYQKYSMPLQTNRILVAESLFQAATTQASDP